MLKNILFLQALLVHLDRLQALLGEKWSAFHDLLRKLLVDLITEQDKRIYAARVNRIFRAFEGTPAEELANDQTLASAAILRYGELGHPSRPVFDLMLRFAVSEDGRLHGEKYYRTVTEEFAATRPAFRWRHLIGLARVTASMYGYERKDRRGHRAPGYEQACKLLGVG